MARRPVVLIHGYSATGESFASWKGILQARGYDSAAVHILTYKSLTNEVTLDDIAEGFDRALRVQMGLDQDEEFDAIVHSTGMLVVRAWLSKYSSRRDRLRHLVGLAPATFGSPLAHKGRGWLGAIFRGNREKGPDFLEAGEKVLNGLELGSRYTWDLAHVDLLGERPFYGETRSTPYVFVFCGTAKYDFPLNLISEDGTDGTVRLAGCPLNTRKIIIDLSTDPSGDESKRRVITAAWSNADIPLVPIRGLHHGTILSHPSAELVDLVIKALSVDSTNAYRVWLEEARAHAKGVYAQVTGLAQWQQLVFRVVDERGAPVPDYFIDFICSPDGSNWNSVKDAYPNFRLEVHVYSSDPSLRCFHIDLGSADIGGQKLGLRLIASSGTDLVGYQGYVEHLRGTDRDLNLWDGIIDLSSLNRQVKFFYPFTTTLVEICLNREPLPLSGFNELAFFPDAPERKALRVAQEITKEMRQRERDQTRLDELTRQFEKEVKKAKHD